METSRRRSDTSFVGMHKIFLIRNLKDTTNCSDRANMPGATEHRFWPHAESYIRMENEVCQHLNAAFL